MTVLLNRLKGLGLTAKNYLELFILGAFSLTLVALRLKDNEVHELQVESMLARFKAEAGAQDALVKAAKEKYEQDK